jgi:DMSO/TMAO reductase YedYZ molybdopterin-dependent catalytic subunit
MSVNVSNYGAVVVCALALLLMPLTSACATSGGYSPAFKIEGAVDHPLTITLKDLKSLPQTSANVYYNTGRGPVSSKFTGVLLWDLLQKAGIKTDPAIKNHILQKIIVVRATDGYAVALTAGELHPQFGGHQVIVVYKQDGKLLGEDDGMARLVFPGDKAGGRAISWIKSIKVY